MPVRLSVRTPQADFRRSKPPPATILIELNAALNVRAGTRPPASQICDDHGWNWQVQNDSGGPELFFNSSSKSSQLYPLYGLSCRFSINLRAFDVALYSLSETCLLFPADRAAGLGWRSHY